jgi:hypothetical protein
MDHWEHAHASHAAPEVDQGQLFWNDRRYLQSV